MLTKTSAFWRSPDLGQAHEIETSAGRLAYHVRGAGPALVFAHGWLANANLWRKLTAILADRFTCYTPDLPFGAHTKALNPNADLSPDGCGRLIVDFLAALNLRDVTLIGNDSGGAYSQIATAADQSRIARLVLNACETPHDEFPPPAFKGLVLAAQANALRHALSPLRASEIRAMPNAYGKLIKHPVDAQASDSYVLPVLEDDGVLHDAQKVMAAASIAPVQAAGEKLISDFKKPVLFAWAKEDNFFPLASAQLYAADLQNARVELIDDAYSFTPEDAPAPLAALIADFAKR